MLAPPKPPPTAELELLIREARARQRRRQIQVAAGVLAAAGLGLALWAAVPGGGSKTRSAGRGRSSVAQRIEAAARDRAPIWNVGTTAGVTWAMNGRHLWLTANGGRTWLALSPRLAGDAGGLSEIQFVDRAHGWIWSQGRGLDRTADGGRTWTHVRLSAPIARAAASFTFVTPRRGYLLAQRHGPELLVTGDGGVTWRSVSRPPFRWAEMSFANAGRGFAVDGKTVYSTADGGRSWKVALRRSTSNAELWAPTAFGRRVVVPELVFPGNPDGPARLVVHSSRDGGSSWTARRAPSSIWGPLDHDQGPPTVGFTALTPDDWVALSSSSVLVTTDAGRTWRTVRSVDLPRRGGIYGGAFTSPREGWALLSVPRSSAVLLRTTDGGAHWTAAGPQWPKRHARR